MNFILTDFTNAHHLLVELSKHLKTSEYVGPNFVKGVNLRLAIILNAFKNSCEGKMQIILHFRLKSASVAS